MSKESESRRIASEAQFIHWTQTQYIEFMATTDSFIGKVESKQIFKAEKLRYQNDTRTVRHTKKIDYNSLNESRTDILSKYSFKVVAGYDDADNPVFVTVRTNRKLTKHQIRKKAESIPSKRGARQYGKLHGRSKILSGNRRVKNGE